MGLRSQPTKCIHFPPYDHFGYFTSYPEHDEVKAVCHGRPQTMNITEINLVVGLHIRSEVFY